MTSGIASAIQIWAISKGGPVLASIYLPLQTLLVALMASIAFAEEFFLGGSVLLNLDYRSFLNMLTSAFAYAIEILVVLYFEVQDYWSFISDIWLIPCCMGKKSRIQVYQGVHSPH